MYNGPQSRRIRAGAVSRNNGGVIHYVSQVHNHPGWGSNGYDADISVVRLATPLTFSNVVQQATIINQGGFLPDNVPVVHAGWGHVSVSLTRLCSYEL